MFLRKTEGRFFPEATRVFMNKTLKRWVLTPESRGFHANADGNELFIWKISKAKAPMFRTNSQNSCITSKILNKLGRN